MASHRSPVAMLKNAGECAALRARIATLESMVTELRSMIEDVVSHPERDVRKGKKSKARRKQGSVRVRPIAESGWAIEDLPQMKSLDERVTPPNQSDDWRVVSGGKGGKVKLRRGLASVETEPIPVRNRYEVLSGDSTNAAPTPAPRAPPRRSRQSLGREGLVVLGSSNVRRIMSPLRRTVQRGGDVGSLSSWCIPGGGVPQATMAVKAAVRNMGCSKLRIVAHVGTNDASSRGSEDILASYKAMNTEVKRVAAELKVPIKLSICSIVPRVDRGNMVWSRIDGINNRMGKFCREMGVDFIDLRPVLSSCKEPLNRSGVHYTAEASQKVARRIQEQMRRV